MNNLISIESLIKKLHKEVIEICKDKPCSYVILFGSYARGDVKPYSDIDLAIKFNKKVDYLKESFEISYKLEEKLGLKIDVIPLNIADIILQYEVFSNGKLIYYRDYYEFLDDFINAIDKWMDFEYHFNKFFRNIIKEMDNAISRYKSENR